MEDQEHKDLIDNIDLESLLAAHTTPTTSGILGKSILKKKSNQFPSLSLNSNLQAFIAMTTKVIQGLNRNQSPDNISDKEIRALELLSNQHQLTIKPSDKGGNIVIMNNSQYESMSKKILSNKEWYQPISKAIIEKFDMKFFTMVDQAYLENTITQQT